MGADRDAVLAAYDGLEAAVDKVAALSVDALAHTELLALLHRREVLSRRQCAVEHRLIARLVTEADPKALGGKNLADLLTMALGISTQDARARIRDAALLGPRTAMTGEALEPVLPNVAAAQARGHRRRTHQDDRDVLSPAAGPHRLCNPRRRRSSPGRHRSRVGAQRVPCGR
jgi:hypothetical protein